MGPHNCTHWQKDPEESGAVGSGPTSILQAWKILELLQLSEIFAFYQEDSTTMMLLIQLFFYQVSQSPCDHIAPQPKSLLLCVQEMPWGRNKMKNPRFFLLSSPGHLVEEYPSWNITLVSGPPLRKMLSQGKAWHLHIRSCYKRGFAQLPCFETWPRWPISVKQPNISLPSEHIKRGANWTGHWFALWDP